MVGEEEDDDQLIVLESIQLQQPLLFALMQSVRGETKGGRKAARSHVWSAQTATRRERERERERERTLQVVGERTNGATATTVAPCSCSNLHATKPCSVSAIL